MIELRVAQGCAPTARVLERLLAAEGARIGPGGHKVSWGVPLADPSALNRNASRLNKYDQLVRLAQAGVKVPDYGQGDRGQGVWLARKYRHVGGRDIMLCLQEEDFAMRKRAGADFFTAYIPVAREFRCWIYRRRHLGSYEKILAHPERYTKIGRNYDNGFAFQLLREDQIPREAVDLASRAVEALGLDFGAVDIILGKDGAYYVLEVNSAPGVEGEDRQVIRALARRIAKWDSVGHPRRNGDEEAPKRNVIPAQQMEQRRQAPAQAPPIPADNRPRVYPRGPLIGQAARQAQFRRRRWRDAHYA